MSQNILIRIRDDSWKEYWVKIGLATLKDEDADVELQYRDRTSGCAKQISNLLKKGMGWYFINQDKVTVKNDRCKQFTFVKLPSKNGEKPKIKKVMRKGELVPYVKCVNEKVKLKFCRNCIKPIYEHDDYKCPFCKSGNVADGICNTIIRLNCKEYVCCGDTEEVNSTVIGKPASIKGR